MEQKWSKLSTALSEELIDKKSQEKTREHRLFRSKIAVRRRRRRRRRGVPFREPFLRTVKILVQLNADKLT